MSWVGGEMKNSLLLTTREKQQLRINSCLRLGLGNKLCLIVSCREPISWRSEEPKQRGTWYGAPLDERELRIYRVISFSRKSVFFGDAHGPGAVKRRPPWHRPSTSFCFDLHPTEDGTAINAPERRTLISQTLHINSCARLKTNIVITGATWHSTLNPNLNKHYTYVDGRGKKFTPFSRITTISPLKGTLRTSHRFRFPSIETHPDYLGQIEGLRVM